MSSAPLPTGITADVGAGRSPAATASVTSRATSPRRSRSADVVAVDEQLGAVRRGARLGRAASRVEVLAGLVDRRAERAHPRDLAAVRARRAEDDGREPSARAAKATPWPKLPALTQATGRSGPILPSPARALTAIHVPRPLNERIGLAVSTLTIDRRAGAGRVRPSWHVLAASRGRQDGSWHGRRGSRPVPGRGLRSHRRPTSRSRRGAGRAHRNARRNRRSVVSAADLHPRHCFRSKAPSGKTYDSRRVHGAGYGVIHDFRRHRASAGRCPQPVHDGASVLACHRAPAATPGRTAACHTRRRAGRSSDRVLAGAGPSRHIAGDPRRTGHVPRSTSRSEARSRRSGHVGPLAARRREPTRRRAEARRRRPPATTNNSCSGPQSKRRCRTPVGVTTLPWSSRQSRIRMERQQPGRRRQLEAGRRAQPALPRAAASERNDPRRP